MGAYTDDDVWYMSNDYFMKQTYTWYEQDCLSQRQQSIKKQLTPKK